MARWTKDAIGYDAVLQTGGEQIVPRHTIRFTGGRLTDDGNSTVVDVSGDGPKGPHGLPGLAGGPGDQGPPGDDGADGLPGSNAADGPDGTDGTDGTDGSDGPAGTPGVDGTGGTKRVEVTVFSDQGTSGTHVPTITDGDSLVICTGGGGGGGLNLTQAQMASGGGGAGGTAIGVYHPTPTSFAWAVGQRGIGGADGGISTVSSTPIDINLQGVAGLAGETGPEGTADEPGGLGGRGGEAFGGDINIVGGSGLTGMKYTGPNVGGHGGMSSFGGGGEGAPGDGDGKDADGYGAGGGGCIHVVGAGPTSDPGLGTGGLIIILSFGF